MTLDANVFVGALTPTGIHFADSLALLTRIRTQKMSVICPTLVLPECAGAIIRPTGRRTLAQQALVFMQTLPNIRFVDLTEDRTTRASDLAITCRLRGADAVYVAVAQEYGTTLITWDQELLTRGIAAATTRTPADWLAANP